MNPFNNNFYKNYQIKFKKIDHLIKQSEKVVILGHINPDGDCIGAQLAFLQSLKIKYPEKQIIAPFAGSNQHFHFLLPEKYQNEMKIKDWDNALYIIVDVANIKRLPIKINTNNKIIQIDHHNQKESFGTISWIDEKSIATCEMLYFLFEELQLPFNQQIANALLAGIISDSGNFQYSKTRAQTFWATYQLMEKKADLNQVNSQINQKKERNLLTLQWILNNYLKKDKFAFINFLPQDKNELLHITEREDIKQFINIFANTENIEIWATFIQLEQNQPVFISIRSKKTNVNTIAQKYGGGGHQNASGIELVNWDLVPQIVTELAEISKND